MLVSAPAWRVGQMPLSSAFDMRYEDGVIRNYGRVVWELAGVVPDGMVVFFVSYSYMDHIISRWHDMGLLQQLTARKLVFRETQVGGA